MKGDAGFDGIRRIEEKGADDACIEGYLCRSLECELGEVRLLDVELVDETKGLNYSSQPVPSILICFG